jgi:undecaprenyl pyrophosphate synthase
MKNIKVNTDQLNEDIFVMVREHPELLDEFLEQEGYNPAEVEKRIVSKIKSLLFKHKVAIKKVQQESLYSKAIAVFVSAQENTKDVILQLLRQRAPKLQFNNLEKMDENDLKSILDESDLLDLMDKIEKDDSR